MSNIQTSLTSEIDRALSFGRALTWTVLFEVVGLMHAERREEFSSLYAKSIHKAVKQAAKSGELIADMGPNGPDLGMVIDISNLWHFSDSRGAPWSWCGDLCGRWARCLHSTREELEPGRPVELADLLPAGYDYLGDAPLSPEGNDTSIGADMERPQLRGRRKFKTESAQRALNKLYKSNWPPYSKQIRENVNSWLRENQLTEVGEDTLQNVIKRGPQPKLTERSRN